jgi:hypothetical protein
MNAVRAWLARAACRRVDPEMFFPAAEAGPEFETQAAAAKAVCAVCPVRARCLEFALTALADGVAGGTSPNERRAIRAERADASRRTDRAVVSVAGLLREAAAGRAPAERPQAVVEVDR